MKCLPKKALPQLKSQLKKQLRWKKRPNKLSRQQFSKPIKAPRASLGAFLCAPWNVRIILSQLDSFYPSGQTRIPYPKPPSFKIWTGWSPWICFLNGSRLPKNQPWEPYHMTFLRAFFASLLITTLLGLPALADDGPNAPADQQIEKQEKKTESKKKDRDAKKNEGKKKKGKSKQNGEKGKPKKEKKPKPKKDEPTPAKKPKAEPKPEPKAEPKPEPKAEPKPEPKAEPKPEPKAEPKPEPKAEPKPEPKAEPKPEPKAEPKP
ncbi:hypothetical protein, partial [Blastopirellula marina]|uniref:hypothetical protein n=1 Tax=Blastopirellula marina TaxID=124 RepID=UPI0039657032